MKWIYLLFVAQFVTVTVAHPSPRPSSNSSRCIKMTKKAEAEIERMISKIGDFVTSLAEVHYKYAITFVKFEIENKDEFDDEIKVVVDINDCGEEQKSGNEEEDEFEFVVDAQKSPDKGNEQKPNEKNQNGGDWKKPREKPELMILDLGGIPSPILNKMDRRRGKAPLLVYIQQRRNNNTDYMFLNRK